MSAPEVGKTYEIAKLPYEQPLVTVFNIEGNTALCDDGTSRLIDRWSWTEVEPDYPEGTIVRDAVGETLVRDGGRWNFPVGYANRVPPIFQDDAAARPLTVLGRIERAS